MSTFETPNYSQAPREILIERIMQLENNQGLRFQTHPAYNLTSGEDALLGILISREQVVSRDTVYTLMYGMYDNPPELKILDVMICKLRKKLAPHGIKINTVWGRGWFVEPADREKVRAMRLPGVDE